MHIVGERGSEDARIADRPGVGRQAVDASAGFSRGNPREIRGHGYRKQASIKDAEQDIFGVDVGIDANVAGVGVFVLDGNVAGKLLARPGVSAPDTAQQHDRVRILACCGNDVQQRRLGGGGEVCGAVAGKARAACRRAVIEGSRT